VREWRKYTPTWKTSQFELPTKYYAGDHIMEGEVDKARMTNGYECGNKILVRKLSGKRPLWMARPKCEDNIKMILKYVGRDGVN
jgi:hypothetical protein